MTVSSLSRRAPSPPSRHTHTCTQTHPLVVQPFFLWWPFSCFFQHLPSPDRLISLSLWCKLDRLITLSSVNLSDAWRLIGTGFFSLAFKSNRLARARDKYTEALEVCSVLMVPLISLLRFSLSPPPSSLWSWRFLGCSLSFLCLPSSTYLLSFRTRSSIFKCSASLLSSCYLPARLW